MGTGYIYIATNPSLDYIKVGMTSRSPKKRISELSSTTSIPTKFEVFWSQKCSQPKILEKKAHGLLKEYRVNRDREFFDISPDKAKEKIVSEEILNTKNNNEWKTREEIAKQLEVAERTITRRVDYGDILRKGAPNDSNNQYLYKVNENTERKQTTLYIDSHLKKKMQLECVEQEMEMSEFVNELIGQFFEDTSSDGTTANHNSDDKERIKKLETVIEIASTMFNELQPVADKYLSEQ